MPDVIISSAAISACERGTQPRRALELFEAMQNEWLAPNVVTRSAAISACEKGTQAGKALELSEAMQKEC